MYKDALEDSLTVISSPRMLSSSQQRYPKYTEQWFLPSLRLKRPYGQILFLTKIYLGFQPVEEEEMTIKCWWGGKKISLKLLSHTISFNLLSSHSSPSFPYVHVHAYTHTHTNTNSFHHHFGHHHKEKWLSFVSWGYFCPLGIVFAGYVTEISHAK